MWCSAADSNGVLDPYHINSAEPEGNDVLLSFRHLNAVYSVHKSDGTVEWKIGGTTRPESLTVLNDPIFTSGGGLPRPARRARPCRRLDHPARQRVRYDCHAQPRAVRYVLDLNARTATLVEQKNDPATTPIAVCCGSARKLSGGNWLMAWGSAGIITELSPSGSRIFDLTWDDGLFSYRSHPVPFGTLSRTALRAGHGRAVSTHVCPSRRCERDALLPCAGLQAMPGTGPHTWPPARLSVVQLADRNVELPHHRSEQHRI